MTQRITALVLAALLAAASSPQASSVPGPAPTMELLVDGRPLQAYSARGTVYIEALKGREYQIRLRNPYPVRVAVALSVDGLNTIDARRTSAADARKWVIEPLDSIIISGWQTSMNDARRFEFTTEERSYGRWLGRTDDLGIITAVFYRERQPERQVLNDRERAPRADSPKPAAPSEAKAMPVGEAGRDQASRAQAAGADEYAATGIGRRTEHAVRPVYLDLEAAPAGSVNVRYEYREQLVRLGVLLPLVPGGDPLERRERARGFDTFCPEPKR